MMAFGRWLILLLVVVALRLPASAADEAPSFERSLTGQYLVAAPTLRDPTFAASVVLIIAHDRNGALGLVVNRRLGSKPMAAFLQSAGVTVDVGTVPGDVFIHDGGPVDPERLFLVHSADYTGLTTRPLADGVSLTTGDDILEAAATGNGPQNLVVVLGYAGWAPGQLEAEVDRVDWLLAPVAAAAIFGDHPDRLWEDVVRHAGTPL